MTRIAFAGAETADIFTEGGNSFTETGNNTFSTSNARSGSRSYLHDSGAGDSTAFCTRSFTGALDVKYFAQIHIYIPSGTGLPSSTTEVLAFYTAGTSQLSARLKSTGKLGLFKGGSQIGSDSSATLTTNTYYRVELALEVGAGAVDISELRLDGTTVASSTGDTISESAPSASRWGFATLAGANKTLHTDDWVLNDDVASPNNTWPGGEKVVLLVPTATNTRNNWVGGAGGTTNLHEAVNNLPPVGVDSASATDTSQIENSTSAADNAYLADMTTYTAAGIGSADTITAILPSAIGSNDSTTGSDTIDIGVDSNPAIAQVSQSIDVNDGTYPTGWNRCVGTLTETPSVTLGTAPVMRVEKNVATTRVNTVCFMGMYVSYTEAVAPPASARGPHVMFIM